MARPPCIMAPMPSSLVGDAPHFVDGRAIDGISGDLWVNDDRNRLRQSRRWRLADDKARQDRVEDPVAIGIAGRIEPLGMHRCTARIELYTQGQSIAARYGRIIAAQRP